MTTIEGSCHCGAVRWSVTPPVKTVVKCHCGNCRKLQGSDYSTWVVVPADIVLALGNLDSYAEALAPQAQVYTPDKASWVTLHDDEPIVS